MVFILMCNNLMIDNSYSKYDTWPRSAFSQYYYMINISLSTTKLPPTTQRLPPTASGPVADFTLLTLSLSKIIEQFVWEPVPIAISSISTISSVNNIYQTSWPATMLDYYRGTGSVSILTVVASEWVEYQGNANEFALSPQEKNQ